MLTPPFQLAAEAPCRLVEALIWEWLGEDLHAVGRHTCTHAVRSIDVASMMCGDGNEDGDDDVDKKREASHICDHHSSAFLQTKMIFFENNSKLISK
jgi:hypothetical protein